MKYFLLYYMILYCIPIPTFHHMIVSQDQTKYLMVQYYLDWIPMCC